MDLGLEGGRVGHEEDHENHDHPNGQGRTGDGNHRRQPVLPQQPPGLFYVSPKCAQTMIV